jgi:PAS domain-containing protein
MKIREDKKIILLSVVGGVMVWVLDAAIDSWLFSQSNFIGSLLSDLSAHEIYFRTFMIVALIIFALVIGQTTKNAPDRGKIQERFELSSDIIYVSDKEGNQIFMNDAAFRILGRTEDRGYRQTDD